MKNIIIGVLITLCIAIWFVKPRQEKKPAGVDPDLRQLVDTEVKRVNKKIDEKGFEHAIIDEVANTVNDLSKLSDSVLRELDSVNALLGIKDGQLKQHIRYSATLQDSLMKARQAITESGDTTYSYTDKWANISYVPTSKGGHFNFTYNAEVNYAEYWRREGIFRTKKHYVDFWISDKRATVNGVNRVKFATQKAPSTLRINAMAMYHDGFHAGADGQVRIGSRYWVGGGYLYDFNSGEWRPMLSTRFVMIDF